MWETNLTYLNYYYINFAFLINISSFFSAYFEIFCIFYCIFWAFLVHICAYFRIRVHIVCLPSYKPKSAYSESATLNHPYPLVKGLSTTNTTFRQWTFCQWEIWTLEKFIGIVIRTNCLNNYAYEIQNKRSLVYGLYST